MPDDRVEQLVDCATAVFIERGYTLTQMADVAEALGVAKGTIYLYVESKEALFDLVARYADAPRPFAKKPSLPVRTPKAGATVRYVRERLAQSAVPPTLAKALEGKRVDDVRTEFDLFRTAAGERGYNAWLNRIAGAPANGPSYGLAHLLDGEIAVRHVLARVDHEVPRYTVDAVRWRDEVVAHQGEHDTWFAGAWLGDGLHEGAVRSASDVAEALGGASIMQLAQQPGRARRHA